jgi:hypothetical protein
MKMNEDELKTILDKHEKWLSNKKGGERADLRDADLRDADLRYANLEGANLQDANLQDANLQDADLQDADLQGANLRYANLRDADLQGANLERANLRYADLQGANLDFSCFPLWCGSFNIIDDGHIAKQLLSHIARLNIRDKKLKSWVEKIPVEYKNEFCERHDINKVK